MDPTSRFLMPVKPQLSRAFLRLRGAPESDLPSVPTSARFTVWWARNAIYHGLSALGIGPGSHVLMPAYICRAAVEPVLALGADVGFYEVSRDCRFDLADIETRIHNHTRALILVHYFGFPQPTARLRDLCTQHGIALIEDCAHVLRGPGDALVPGGAGSLAVFSWGKFLPVNDGGELVLNQAGLRIDIPWDHEGLLLTARGVKDVLDQLLAGSSPPGLASLHRCLQVPKRLLRHRTQTARLPGDPDDRFNVRLARFPASRLSRWIWSHSDTAAVAETRRHNYRLLLEALTALPGVTPLLPDLPPHVCPWVLPVFVHGIPSAHRRLRERGVPATSWDGVRHSAVQKGTYPSADFLYDNLLFLPVHQSLHNDHLGIIVDSLRQLVGSRPSSGRS